jgi:alkylhydroperoxidase family enzyme
MTERAEQQDILYQQIAQAIQTSPGATSPALRQALTAYVIQQDLAGAPHFAPGSGIPVNLQTYVTKVRKHAYKVTDEDTEQLLKDGYSEEAIFEITLSIALGAGTKCLTRGMAAIEGASDATTIY